MRLSLTGLFILLITVLPPGKSLPNPTLPFKLEPNKQYNTVPQINDFKYWYGDIDYGMIVYIGEKDLSGFETELQIYFNSKMISFNKIVKIKCFHFIL